MRGDKLSPKFISCRQPPGCCFLVRQPIKTTPGWAKATEKMSTCQPPKPCNTGQTVMRRSSRALSLTEHVDSVRLMPAPIPEDQPHEGHLFQRTCLWDLSFLE